MKHSPLRFLSLLLLAVAASLTTAVPSRADVRLPSFFNNHMVLQQQKPVKLWGWADAGEAVMVTIGDSSAETKANEAGRWQVELPAMKAGSEPVTVTVKGNNTLELTDVLIGEVWLCSGQSNMEWTVSRCTNAEAELAAANDPLIRHMKVPRIPNTMPQDVIDTEWQVCTPETVGNFTACGYFMAVNLRKELGVPIGLINSSWGGTRVEPWTPPVGFEKVPALQDIYQSVMGRTPGTEKYKGLLSGQIAATEEWLNLAKSKLDSTTEVVPPSPAFPAELVPFQSHQDPTMLYNGMIHAMVGIPLRGAIWYQGESNHHDGMMYFEKKKALINGWRELWGQGDFPFYYVQIAPYQYGSEDPTILAVFWEAQAAVQQIPNTGMVVVNDIATLDNIHPPNKQDVGLRLANLALKYDYGKTDIVADSPEFDSLEVRDGSLKVTFGRTGGGLKTRDGAAPTHFEIIGPNSSGFQPATAQIEGDSVVLTSPDVAKPVAFRFAWHKLAEPNLTGGTGLPVGACRAGEVPEFFNTLPIGKGYQLVYDLDLSQLGHDIHYAVDNSDHISSFDRIGYLVELKTADGKEQKLFVSMKPFTEDAKKIGIPTLASGAQFQQSVELIDVYSTVSGIETGSKPKAGNIEFWPGNYGPQNDAKVSGASSSIYDTGDTPSAPTDGYGSMQVHDTAARQTLFAINQWKAAGNGDIGIGNSEGKTRDWTFSRNASSYPAKRLRIFARTSAE